MRFYSIDEQSIEEYLAQPNVVFKSANAIELIITQKYLASFMRLGWQPYYTHLRTGSLILITMETVY